MKREKISEILARDKAGGCLTAAGWVRSARLSQNVAFIDLTDGSSPAGLQVVLSPDTSGFELMERVHTGSSVLVEGELADSPGKGQKFELQAANLTLLGEADPETYPIQKKKHTMEFLRTKAHLRVRTNTFAAVFRLRSHLSQGIHDFFRRKGFFYIHSPVITTSDCEGAGQMFQVKTSGDEEFFGRPAWLTVSGQLEAELMALGLSEVYTFGPTFRAENSNTPRHLSEFWMAEPEMAFYDLNDNMDLAEEFIKALLSYMIDNDPADLEFMQRWYQKGLLEQLEQIIEKPFQRLSYTEAIGLLGASGKEFEFPTGWGDDIQTEHERYLSEEKFGGPVILFDYPAKIKPFYMRLNDDGKTVGAMDVLLPRIGEIIGGSQREERYDVLLARIRKQGLNEKAYEWFLDTRRFGTVPHSGFGLGLERTMLFLSGMANIRDVIPFPRTPGNAEF
ncbi:MAG: asparagine--tRNA ligase [Candidatus Glassbacteria bacterium]|nr:asparagine--tRNA ligase [Candidatus Glassbacteria bacterium]